MDNKVLEILNCEEKFKEYVSTRYNVYPMLSRLLKLLRSNIVRHLNLGVNYELFVLCIPFNIMYVHYDNKQLYHVSMFDDHINTVRESILSNNFGFADVDIEQIKQYSIYDSNNGFGLDIINQIVNGHQNLKDLGVNMYPIKINNEFSEDIKLYTIKIRFNPEIHNVYKVQPLIKCPNNNLYDMYKNKVIPFDYAIASKNQTFGVHRVILYINGGEYFKPLFEGNFNQPDSTNLTEFADETIETFIEYIYGSDKISNDVIEMYELAEFVQNKDLITDTLNLINYSSKQNDREMLTHLSERYKNKYLASIIENLE